MSRRNKEELPHSLLHAILLVATLVTVYPILWVLTIALSGKQSLAIADLPATPAVSDRLRAVIPWPESISLANFRSLFTDQPFTRWLINSVTVSGGSSSAVVIHDGALTTSNSRAPTPQPEAWRSTVPPSARAMIW